MSYKRVSRILTIGCLICCSIQVNFAAANEVKIAVASNFLSTLNEIKRQFSQDTGHMVIVSSGSSGKLYAQIKHGAPFDVFFSADAERPMLLERERLAVQRSRFTYAIGRLTLWSSDPMLIKEDGPMVLSEERFDHIAMANPKTAPYGRAARQILARLGAWQKVQRKAVYGENIGQTFQFVFSNNAQLGFVALSQVSDPKMKEVGSRWEIPINLYDSLQQQAVLLENGRNNEVATLFLQYIQAPKAKAIIQRYGYGLVK